MSVKTMSKYKKKPQEFGVIVRSRRGENPEKLIANVVSSSFSSHSASFKRQVYISRVALYDDNKNLIGIATLSNPILKEEDQDYTFKLKLDM